MSNIKKHIIPIWLVLACIISKNTSVAQDSTIFTYFDEVSVNINQSLLFFNTENGRTGFGVGVYVTSKKEKVVQWQTGIEYNYTHIFVNHIIEGHFSSKQNVDLSAHLISIPINLRLVFGHKIKPFVQIGAFLDFPFLSKASGIHSYEEVTNTGQFSYHKEKFVDHNWDKQVKIGFSGAIGSIFKIKSYHFGWKAEYKFGLIPIYYDPQSVVSVNCRVSLFWCFK